MADPLPERRGRGPARFRQRDLRAAIRAARAAGEEAFAAEVATDGTIRIIVGGEAARAAPAPESNPWDDED